MNKWEKLKKQLEKDKKYLESLDFGDAWSESRAYNVTYVLELIEKIEMGE